MAVDAKGGEHPGQALHGPRQLLAGGLGLFPAGGSEQVQGGEDIVLPLALLQGFLDGLGDGVGLLLNLRLPLGFGGFCLPHRLPEGALLGGGGCLLAQILQNLVRPADVAGVVKEGGLLPRLQGLCGLLGLGRGGDRFGFVLGALPGGFCRRGGVRRLV